MSATDGPGEALLRRAGELLRSGPIDAAIEAHERLVAARPELSDAWYNLAYLQRWARRFEAALASYAQALSRGVSQPEDVHVNRAVILAEHLGDDVAAQAELEAALALQPGYLPALLNLGNLHEDRGAREPARAAYEQALTADPDNARALARLAGLGKVSDPGDPLIARLREAMARPEAGADDKAELGFALGRALDAAGAYDEAFAAFAEANAASRASAPPPGVRYDRATQEQLIDRLIAAFPEPVPSAGAAPRQAPLFILGMFRSGSTLAEQILAAHSRVTAGGELEFLPALARSELRPYPEAAAAAAPEKIEQLRQAYLDSVRALHPDADIVTDKRPDNFLHIGLIKTLFPHAKIIHTRRDPLDNILSVYFLHFQHSIAYGLDLSDATHWYRQYRRLMAHWRSLYPDDIHDLDYEKLVAEPRATLAGLLDFCGLDWEEGLLDFHAAANVVRTASVWQVRQPLYRRSAGRWRNYQAHLAEVRAALGEL